MVHFDDFDQFAGRLRELLAGRYCQAAHDVSGSPVQQLSRVFRRKARHQQFGKPALVQADCVCVWAAVVFDTLHCPSVIEDDGPQFVEVLVDGAAGVVALPAHGRAFLW
jgi:hypothetical protein